ncbi:phosphoribosylglycinamide formyltransferase [Idiomarina tyrosinivorans]|uniref:Phosphoribosylglycinamide formyltransferase n=1 Tax=Idiomarina tyrosinivorans TaxID=1445662 RepID=A0A432ZM26_9GAMM|nr:phosphoribosylglycinamide formyltransferase [Idiomarina tyrosinivorans]RUO78927.1 phosphoribosylglycinamide formyltransferase [Idiomarina tyrosinivorans]
MTEQQSHNGNCRIVVLISGSGTNMQAIQQACQAGKVAGNVVAVISNKAGVGGLAKAQAAGIDTAVLSHRDFDSREAYDAELQQLIDTYRPDLVVLAGFMRILTPAFTRHYQGRMLNIHPSLLPKYKGTQTHQRALEAGDEEHGVSVHFVTEELDGGPVILQAKVPIFPGDTVEDLQARVHEQEHRIYPMVVNWFCQGRLTLAAGQAQLDQQALGPQGYAAD